MTAANLDAADLAGAVYGGLIKEEVMDKIWNLTRIPLPFTDRCPQGTVDAGRFSWVQDALANPVTTGQQIDGADTTSLNNTAVGTRVQNVTETRVKVVQVSTRSESVSSIGDIGSLAYQVMMRQQELRRDVEATALANNGSVAGDGTTTAAQTGTLNAWLVANTSNGATGVNGGFNTSTGVVAAYTPGTKRALSEATFKDALQAVYQNGGEAMLVMARPVVVRRFSEYQFSSGARVATMRRETAGQEGPGSALGAVNVYIGDFATVEVVANRLQPTTAAATSTLYVLDMSQLEMVYLTGYRVEPLAKTGLAEKRQMLVDWGLRVGTEKGLAAIRDIDEALAMTA
jgi:anti-anti-sigma regulatory factor